MYDFKIITDPKYDKSVQHPIGYGYGNNRLSFDSIIIHTTNGRAGTTSLAEVNYLVHANNVSAHYLIGKNGEIYQILNPRFVAWHVGAATKAIYDNRRSIGIEVHFTPAEGEWTAYQKTALTYLTQYLMEVYRITQVQTHRDAASPKGRKIDPSGFNDQDFKVWLSMLNSEGVFREYFIRYNYTYIRSKPTIHSNPLGQLNANTRFYGYKQTVLDLEGEYINGSNEWVRTIDNKYIHYSLVK